MDEDSELALRCTWLDLHNNNANPPCLSIISSFLDRQVEKNDGMLQEGEETITIFHGSSPPALSIHDYILRIFKYTGCTPSCLIAAVIYVDRYLQRTHFRLTSLNVHRLFLASVMVAAKFMDNAYCSNAHYARVGGITTEELNELEISFLFTIEFRLLDIPNLIHHCRMLADEPES